MSSKDAMDKAELFVQLFYKNIKDGKLNYVTDMYELTFYKISEDYFKDQPWPHPETLKHLVKDYVFWMLYYVRFSFSVRVHRDSTSPQSC
jgi:hypothetical protein